MSTLSGGPNIVTNGLVLSLDAANTKSYTSGSTAWKDISKTAGITTLINGPTFSGANGGSIVFDGVDDYANTTYTPPVSNFTINIIYKCTTFAPWAGLWACEIWNNSSGYLAYFATISTLVFSRGGGAQMSVTADSTTLKYYTFSLDSSGVGKIYINGILQSSDPIIGLSSSVEKPIILSTRYSNNGTGITDTRASIIPLLSVYNRVLTASEVLQNFNATKTRFGL
jgi:hypothetical protein